MSKFERRDRIDHNYINRLLLNRKWLDACDTSCPGSKLLESDGELYLVHIERFKV